MQVEVYTIDEVQGEDYMCSEEASLLIEKLGLDGQRALMVNGSTERVPYREMLKSEQCVYKMICPNVVEIKEYRAEPIPLRILQVAAHADSLNYFDKIQVWCKQDASIKDPLLVGKKSVNYDDHFYLLARWGDMLEEFSVLERMAIAMFKEKATRFRRYLRTRASKIAAFAEDGDLENGMFLYVESFNASL